MEASRGDKGAASWTARVLAPVALIAVALVIGVVVTGSLDGSGDEGRDRDRTATASEPGCNPAADQALEDGFYVVEPGEPGLSSVADRTCIPVERLTKLNPNLDPQLIPVGACVDLRPEGCKAAG